MDPIIPEGKKAIACFGSGKGEEGESGYDAMVQVGKLIAERGFVVLTGAYGGAGMEAPACGVNQVSGGKAIGLSLGKAVALEPNRFLSSVVNCTALADEINIPNAGFGVRLASLMSADGFVLCACGGIGTMLELMAFLLFATKLWSKQGVVKRLAVLMSSPHDLLEGKTFEDFRAAGLVSDEVANLVKFVVVPESAVKWVLDGK